MTPEQALQILDNIARIANMSREAHALAQTAVQTLADVLRPKDAAQTLADVLRPKVAA